MAYFLIDKTGVWGETPLRHLQPERFVLPGMAQQPIGQRDPAKPDRSNLANPPFVNSALAKPAFANSDGAREGLSAARASDAADLGARLNFSELAAKLAARGGGKISAEVSRELALDILLNEIVEQACVQTGAIGAAIALRRGGEMVCRASSGENAPKLGTRLNAKSGLTGVSVQSGEVQYCDDAFSDPRADGEASRQMGVRSLVVQPILGGQKIIGVLEIFSPLPAAFGEQDLRALNLLALRILENIEASRAPLIANPVSSNPTASPVLAHVSPDATVPKPGSGEGTVLEESISESIAERRFDWFANLMGAVIVLVAVVMGAMLGMRVGWLKGYRLGRASNAARISATDPHPSLAPSSALSSAPSASSNSATFSQPSPSDPATNAQVNSGKGGAVGGEGPAEDAQVPDGGLRVYENGREVFRMPAAKNTGTNTAQPNPKVSQSQDVAEGGLLRRVEPEYPEKALAQRVQGPVVLGLRIGKDGAVQNVNLVSGDPLLVNAAMAAVRQWRFKPRTENGRAVEMETQITLNFSLPPQ
jgi:TonB family protein